MSREQHGGFRSDGRPPARTLAGAAGFAGHIAALSEWATPVNSLGITTVSVTVAALGCTLAAAVTGNLSAPPSLQTCTAVVYVALVATCLGLAVVAWAQGVCQPSRRQ